MGYSLHGLNESVQLLLLIRFGRLNHQRLINYERKVSSRRVYAIVQDSLRYIEGAHPTFLAHLLCAENALMLSLTALSIRKLKTGDLPQLLQDIIGI